MTDQTDKAQLRQFTGTVVSAKQDNTVGVEIERQWKHPLYGKYVTRTNTIQAHNEEFDVDEGDTVTIESCRPISKTKKFKVIEKVEG